MHVFVTLSKESNVWAARNRRLCPRVGHIKRVCIKFATLISPGCRKKIRQKFFLSYSKKRRMVWEKVRIRFPKKMLAFAMSSPEGQSERTAQDFYSLENEFPNGRIILRSIGFYFGFLRKSSFHTFSRTHGLKIFKKIIMPRTFLGCRFHQSCYYRGFVNLFGFVFVSPAQLSASRIFFKWFSGPRKISKSHATH